MSSIRKNINAALKMLGVVGGHGDSASDTELAECLEYIHGMYHRWISMGAFGRLVDVTPPGDYVAGENQRVFRRVNTGQTIRVPDLVSECGRYGYCLDQTTEDLLGLNATPFPTTDYGRLPFRTRLNDRRRAIRDLSVIVINDEMAGTTDEAIYDAQQKKWFVISDLDHDFDLTDEDDLDLFNEIMDREAPLSRRDQIGFRAFIASQVADLYGAELTPMIVQNAKVFEDNLTLRYGESNNYLSNFPSLY